VLSVAALVGVFLSYLITSFRVFCSRFRMEESWLIGLGCFTGIVGYLGAGLFNDSVVSVAPVFWVILGAGMRANALLDVSTSRPTHVTD
jgi:hypothetical protein